MKPLQYVYIARGKEPFVLLFEQFKKQHTKDQVIPFSHKKQPDIDLCVPMSEVNFVSESHIGRDIHPGWITLIRSKLITKPGHYYVTNESTPSVGFYAEIEKVKGKLTVVNMGDESVFKNSSKLRLTQTIEITHQMIAKHPKLKLGHSLTNPIYKNLITRPQIQQALEEAKKRTQLKREKANAAVKAESEAKAQSQKAPAVEQPQSQPQVHEQYTARQESIQHQAQPAAQQDNEPTIEPQEVSLGDTLAMVEKESIDNFDQPIEFESTQVPTLDNPHQSNVLKDAEEEPGQSEKKEKPSKKQIKLPKVELPKFNLPALSFVKKPAVLVVAFAGYFLFFHDSEVNLLEKISGAMSNLETTASTPDYTEEYKQELLEEYRIAKANYIDAWPDDAVSLLKLLKTIDAGTSPTTYGKFVKWEGTVHIAIELEDDQALYMGDITRGINGDWIVPIKTNKSGEAL